MIVAKIATPGTGDAYLGTQGDVWDAQMDMSCAAVGAVICMATTAVVRQILHKGPDLLAGEGKRE